jgi:hypothetical protein
MGGRPASSAGKTSAGIARGVRALGSVDVAGVLFDAAERAPLCDLLDELGPQAPTLLDRWTTRDLAAHLVLREHDLLAAPGLVVPGAWGRFAERRRLASNQTACAELVAAVRSGHRQASSEWDGCVASRTSRSSSSFARMCGGQTAWDRALTRLQKTPRCFTISSSGRWGVGPDHGRGAQLPRCRRTTARPAPARVDGHHRLGGRRHCPAADDPRRYRRRERAARHAGLVPGARGCGAGTRPSSPSRRSRSPGNTHARPPAAAGRARPAR